MYLDMRKPEQSGGRWDRHYGRWLERIEEAERLGAPAVWLTEHHFFDDGYLPQCWTFAAAIAARTSKVRIGTAVALLPLHSSIELAEQIALVDIISGGRIEPGFGVGYRKPEYLAFRADFKHRYSVFAERIVELRQWWGEVPGVERTVTPAPIQRPVPMWAGFGGPQGARLAGRLGLGLMSTEPELLEPYQAGLSEGGHDRSAARTAGTLEFFLSDDPERAWAEIKDCVMYRWESYNRYMFEGTRHEADPPRYFEPETVAEEFMLGTPEQVAQMIKKRYEGLPVTDLYAWSDYPGISEDTIDQHLELTFTRLAPLVR
jgi:alkanesulfonate monooxygenase SsuD/methylene tetrahydromethanopterin reductase-like flavin-dependent oxidoreductase (luciferase family)